MATITAVINRFTRQTLVYWQKVGPDSYGKPRFASPVEVACRWEDKQQEIVLEDGRKVHSIAYILLSTPVMVGSLVFLGRLTDWQALPTYPKIPTVNQGTREVLLLKTTPDIRAQANVYEAYL